MPSFTRAGQRLSNRARRAGMQALCAWLAATMPAAAQVGPQTPADAIPAIEQGAPAAVPAAGAARDPARGPVTNLPLPRYVSLKGSEGNARRGPSLSHRIDWVFRHAGMPLRVTAEYGHWRRVEDRESAGGWVHYSLLSGVRTALVLDDMADFRSRPQDDAPIVARAEAGVIVRLGKCNADWCEVSAAGSDGWLPKRTLWGVDPAELRE